MRITKAFKIAQYDQVTKERDLLRLYLWDQEQGIKANDSVHVGEWYMRLYRATGANGGYVVLKPRGGVPDVMLLDDLIRRYQEDSHPSTLDLRLCVERMQVARNRAYEAMKVGGAR